MIRLQALSFGFGIRIGRVHLLDECDYTCPTITSATIVPTFQFLPNIEEFDRSALAPKVAFCIVPLCSPYSHLAAHFWATDVPTITVDMSHQLVDGQVVLADFEKGLLLVAESESETANLYHMSEEYAKSNQQQPESMNSDNLNLGVSVLAEVASSDGIRHALNSGADGLGVMRVEDLFSGMSEQNQRVDSLIHEVKSAPQLLPLLIRFFDTNQFQTNDKRSNIPDPNLGYRGTRILEVNDSRLHQFINVLESLDLEDIIVILPMVTSASEVEKFKKLLPSKWNRVGVTVETPAAALVIDELLEVADYIQIGLNDLTQYTMAWDRNVPNKERLPWHNIAKPVGDLISYVASSCNSAGVRYTLGMDLRPSIDLANQVRSLNINSISCAPSLVKRWKDTLAATCSFNTLSTSRS